MKRTFLLSGVGAAMLFATLATATSGRMEQLMAPETTSAQPIAAASAATLPTAGESIGTVDAILYADSGLDLEDFNAEYVARTSDNTYLGFAITSIWVTNPETGNYERVECASLADIQSSDEAITVPDCVKIDDMVRSAVELQKSCPQGRTPTAYTSAQGAMRKTARN